MPGLPEVTSLGEHFARNFCEGRNDWQTRSPGDYLRHGARPAYKAVTAGQGNATLVTNEASLVRVIASPSDTYWSRVIEDVTMTDAGVLEITLKPLLVTGAYYLGGTV